MCNGDCNGDNEDENDTGETDKQIDPETLRFVAFHAKCESCDVEHGGVAVIHPGDDAEVEAKEHNATLISVHDDPYDAHAAAAKHDGREIQERYEVEYITHALCKRNKKPYDKAALHATLCCLATGAIEAQTTMVEVPATQDGVEGLAGALKALMTGQLTQSAKPNPAKFGGRLSGLN